MQPVLTTAHRTSLVPSSMPSSVDFDISRYSSATRDFLIRNQQRSIIFASLEAQRAREDWLLSHHFRFSADLCIDGRVSDFSEALGLPPGLLEMYRSGGCRNNQFSSCVYSERVRRGNVKYRNEIIGRHTAKRMVEVRMVTFHYSSSHQATHSCAAWSNRTEDARSAMHKHADKLNHIYEGHMVAFVVGVDTDTDGVTVFGPSGSLDASAYAGKSLSMNGDLQQLIAKDLQNIFPADWPVLTKINDPGISGAFHHQLAECLAHDARFVQKVRDTNRPFESLIHGEKLMFAGRPSESSDHNEAFLVEDRERQTTLANANIALNYVVLNLIRKCVEEDHRDVIVPVVISIPHDPDPSDRLNAIESALGIRHGDLYDQKNGYGLEGQFQRCSTDLQIWLQSHKHLLPKGELPLWTGKLVNEIHEHVDWCITVNDRRNRLFVPVT